LYYDTRDAGSNPVLATNLKQRHMTHMQIVTMICAALLIYSDVIDLVRGNGSNILISLTLFSLMMWDLDSRAGFVTAISSLILLLTIIVYKNK